MLLYAIVIDAVCVVCTQSRYHVRLLASHVMTTLCQILSSIPVATCVSTYVVALAISIIRTPVFLIHIRYQYLSVCNVLSTPNKYFCCALSCILNHKLIVQFIGSSDAALGIVIRLVVAHQEAHNPNLPEGNVTAQTTVQ